MKIKLTARPFALDIEHEGRKKQVAKDGRFSFMGRYWLGDSIYRATVRRQMGALLVENRRLRHGRRPGLPSLLAQAFDSWLRRKYPDPPPLIGTED